MDNLPGKMASKHQTKSKSSTFNVQYTYIIEVGIQHVFTHFLNELPP